MVEEAARLSAPGVVPHVKCVCAIKLMDDKASLELWICGVGRLVQQSLRYDNYGYG